MDASVRLSLREAEDLCTLALVQNNTSEVNALATARALVRAEADGQKGHGLSRVASYAAQALSGKVDGHATPVIDRITPAMIRIDAKSGFAYPSVDLACEELLTMTRESGIAIAAIGSSHHLGQAGAPAERLADQGLVAIILSNTPKAISFWGGKKPMMGTNPIAFAAPRLDKAPLLIDLSMSIVARGKILAARQAGQPIPEGWALDANGQPTTDPEAAMQGSMLPIGNAKGAALALMVEILSAALTGSHFGFQASSFFEPFGDPPNIGHLFITIDPEKTSRGEFRQSMEVILAEIEGTPGARIPGSSRLANRQKSAENGVTVSVELFNEITDLTNGGGERLG